MIVDGFDRERGESERALAIRLIAASGRVAATLLDEELDPNDAEFRRRLSTVLVALAGNVFPLSWMGQSGNVLRTIGKSQQAE